MPPHLRGGGALSGRRGARAGAGRRLRALLNDDDLGAGGAAHRAAAPSAARRLAGGGGAGLLLHLLRCRQAALGGGGGAGLRQAGAARSARHALGCRGGALVALGGQGHLEAAGSGGPLEQVLLSGWAWREQRGLGWVSAASMCWHHATRQQASPSARRRPLSHRWHLQGHVVLSSQRAQAGRQRGGINHHLCRRRGAGTLATRRARAGGGRGRGRCGAAGAGGGLGAAGDCRRSGQQLLQGGGHCGRECGQWSGGLVGQSSGAVTSSARVAATASQPDPLLPPLLSAMHSCHARAHPASCRRWAAAGRPGWRASAWTPRCRAAARRRRRPGP